MSFAIVLLPRARQELLDAWNWYEDKQTGLGDRFKDELYDTLHQIESHPQHYPVRKRPYRETLIKIFPYVVIYRILKKEKLVVVSSIFHTSRNPRKKYK